MDRPFPGIDPYIEGQHYWPDFHSRFLNVWCEAIAGSLPDEYEARLDERVDLTEPDAETLKLIEPDIAVIRTAARRRHPGGGAAVLEPETIPTIIFEESRATYIKVLHRPDRRLVAVLELLSPSNKANPGRRDYLGRRNAILRQDVHLVEVDLLLAGERLPMARPLPRGDCFALVARWERRPDCEVYAWSIRDPLPPLPVPLRAPDPDVWVDLAEVYATTYTRGRYARSVEYAAPLDLPLAAEDRAWAEARGRAARPG